MLRPQRHALATCALLIGLAAGCGSAVPGEQETGGPPDGAALFNEPGLGFTQFACATCHAISEPAMDGFRRPGHPVGDAHARPSFKNGQLEELRDAVNSCVVEWIKGEALSANDPRWLALRDFLAMSAPASAPALSYEIVSPPDVLDGGDPVAGQATFNETCANCHGANALGGAVGPTLVQTIQTPDYIAQRVRLSGTINSSVYSGLQGGAMPFWAADRLSDDELRDIIAFVNDAYDPSSTTSTSSGETTDSGTTDGTTDTGSGCDSDHPMVGQLADLDTFFHQVAGTAEIIDNCTIEIRNFTYDGTGLDVRIYGGLGENYAAGFPMTEDLLKAGGYDNETIYATLPDGMTFDDLDGISVWCVDVAIDFGSGLFSAP